MAGADLKYNIAEERLYGLVGGTSISCAAGSGGRAGTKTAGAGNWWLQNNVFATHVHNGEHNYGPLPMGSYFMYPHEKTKNMVRLEPFKTNRMFGRTGFLIHGRGKIGSHGCIVPYDFQEVVKVSAAIAHHIKKTGSRPVLEVIAVGSNLTDKLYTA